MSFSKALLVILSISTLPMVAGAEIDLKKYAAEAEANAVRLSESYQRVHHICSTNYDLSKSVYAAAAAAEVSQIAFLNVETWQTKYLQKYAVSKMLEEDLLSPGFRLALSDCGYSDERQESFVLNLVTLDVFGKLGGLGLSLWLYTKVIFKAGKFLLARMSGQSSMGLIGPISSETGAFAAKMELNSNISLSLVAAALAVRKFIMDSAEEAAPRPQVSASDVTANLMTAANLSGMKANRLRAITNKLKEIEAEEAQIPRDSDRYRTLEEKRARLTEIANMD